MLFEKWGCTWFRQEWFRNMYRMYGVALSAVISVQRNLSAKSLKLALAQLAEAASANDARYALAA